MDRASLEVPSAHGNLVVGFLHLFLLLLFLLLHDLIKLSIVLFPLLNRNACVELDDLFFRSLVCVLDHASSIGAEGGQGKLNLEQTQTGQ